MSEAKYTFDLGVKGERDTDVYLSGNLKVHTTPTGVIQLTLYGNPGGVRVNLGIEVECETEVQDGDTRRYLTPAKRVNSLGGVGLDLMSGSYEGLLVGRMATWLAEGYIAGPAVQDAVWDVLWFILKNHRPMRNHVAESYPKWIAQLGLDNK